MKTLLGSKIGMTQVHTGQGAFTAVTVVHAGPCEVLAVRTMGRDSYSASQLGYGRRSLPFGKRRLASGSVVANPSRFVREVCSHPSHSIGQQLTVAIFSDVKKVDVVGVSKGRGFAGVIKRHNFSGVCASHGVKKVHRSGGSTGQSTDPGRVFKGTKMPGRLGGNRVTVKSLRLLAVIAHENLILIGGAVPGFSGGSLIVRESV